MKKTYKTWEGPAPFAIASHRIASKLPFVLFFPIIIRREREKHRQTEPYLWRRERESSSSYQLRLKSFPLRFLSINFPSPPTLELSTLVNPIIQKTQRLRDSETQIFRDRVKYILCFHRRSKLGVQVPPPPPPFLLFESVSDNHYHPLFISLFSSKLRISDSLFSTRS
ncbi:hypothetical protein DVH24_028669 [Malus domestica]|uniref:Uncharacterized protein n=1 Tax=Malus domestica TaxID=3750 RepID=A0A498IV02_MALDO|nr:hypothetical protein DVH24_028669 [Malus domestica]